MVFRPGRCRPSMFSWTLSRCLTSTGASIGLDLPTAQREEVMRLIQAAKDVDLVGQLDERAKENERTMIFFRWYGVNVHTFLDVPAFHQPWKYIETIGVSIFNRRVSTSKHFGFMRATL